MTGNLIKPGGLLHSLVRLWWVVVGITALAIAAAVVFSVSQERVIPARGQIALANTRVPDLESDGSNLAAGSRVGQESSRVLSVEVIDAAAATIGLQPAELRRTVTARPAEEGAIVLIDGRAQTAAESAERVNAVIAAYQARVVQDRQERTAELTSGLNELISNEAAQVAQLEVEQDELEAQLRSAAQDQSPSNPTSALRNLQLASTEWSELASELSASRSLIRGWERRKTALEANLAVFDSGIDFAREANGPSGSPEPNLQRNVVLATILGLVIGTSVAWSLNSEDESSRSGGSKRRRRSRQSSSTNYIPEHLRNAGAAQAAPAHQGLPARPSALGGQPQPGPNPNLYGNQPNPQQTPPQTR